MPTDPLTAVIRAHAVTHRDTPFQLASGQLSSYYVDVKRALCRPDVLRETAAEIVALTRHEGITFTAVGGLTMGADAVDGLTMGADAVAVGVSLASGVPWFSVRKEPKERGHGRAIEGAQLGEGDQVLLVDDVVSTGSSTLKALDAVEAAGATAAAAVPVVDRGGEAAAAFARRGVRYCPLLTHQQLGIPALGSE